VRCKTLTQSINPGFVCDLCSNYGEAGASQLVSGEEGWEGERRLQEEDIVAVETVEVVRC